MKKLLWTSCLTVALSWLGLSIAQAWSLEEAAKDYKGTEVKFTFLDRPGYRAAIEMLPEFEKLTGDLAIALVDLVWMGEFAESGWIVPVDEIKRNSRTLSILISIWRTSFRFS